MAPRWGGSFKNVFNAEQDDPKSSPIAAYRPEEDHLEGSSPMSPSSPGTSVFYSPDLYTEPKPTVSILLMRPNDMEVPQEASEARLLEGLVTIGSPNASSPKKKGLWSTLSRSLKREKARTSEQQPARHPDAAQLKLRADLLHSLPGAIPPWAGPSQAPAGDKPWSSLEPQQQQAGAEEAAGSSPSSPSAGLLSWLDSPTSTSWPLSGVSTPAHSGPLSGVSTPYGLSGLGSPLTATHSCACKPPRHPGASGAGLRAARPQVAEEEVPEVASNYMWEEEEEQEEEQRVASMPAQQQPASASAAEEALPADAGAVAEAPDAAAQLRAAAEVETAATVGADAAPAALSSTSTSQSSSPRRTQEHSELLLRVLRTYAAPPASSSEPASPTSPAAGAEGLQQPASPASAASTPGSGTSRSYSATWRPTFPAAPLLEAAAAAGSPLWSGVPLSPFAPAAAGSAGEGEREAAAEAAARCQAKLSTFREERQARLARRQARHSRHDRPGLSAAAEAEAEAQAEAAADAEVACITGAVAASSPNSCGVQASGSDADWVPVLEAQAALEVGGTVLEQLAAAAAAAAAAAEQAAAEAAAEAAVAAQLKAAEEAAAAAEVAITEEMCPARPPGMHRLRVLRTHVPVGLKLVPQQLPPPLPAQAAPAEAAAASPAASVPATATMAAPAALTSPSAAASSLLAPVSVLVPAPAAVVLPAPQPAAAGPAAPALPMSRSAATPASPAAAEGPAGTQQVAPARAPSAAAAALASVGSRLRRTFGRPPRSKSMSQLLAAGTSSCSADTETAAAKPAQRSPKRRVTDGSLLRLSLSWPRSLRAQQEPPAALQRPGSAGSSRTMSPGHSRSSSRACTPEQRAGCHSPRRSPPLQVLVLPPHSADAYSHYGSRPSSPSKAAGSGGSAPSSPTGKGRAPSWPRASSPTDCDEYGAAGGTAGAPLRKSPTSTHSLASPAEERAAAGGKQQEDAAQPQQGVGAVRAAVRAFLRRVSGSEQPAAEPEVRRIISVEAGLVAMRRCRFQRPGGGWAAADMGGQPAFATSEAGHRVTGP